MHFVNIQGEFINVDLLARFVRKERTLTLYLSGLGDSHGFRFPSEDEAQAAENEILRVASGAAD